jgi:hypothetical protein
VPATALAALQWRGPPLGTQAVHRWLLSPWAGIKACYAVYRCGLSTAEWLPLCSKCSVQVSVCASRNGGVLATAVAAGAVSVHLIERPLACNVADLGHALAPFRLARAISVS